MDTARVNLSKELLHHPLRCQAQAATLAAFVERRVQYTDIKGLTNAIQSLCLHPKGKDCGPEHDCHVRDNRTRDLVGSKGGLTIMGVSAKGMEGEAMSFDVAIGLGLLVF